jgi:hypothetical protein
MMAMPAAAQSRAAPPVFDQLASPFTESELGGVGCLIASAAATGIMLWLMGGPTAVATAIGGVASPSLALQGAAAGAFVYSSACYIGQALSPLGLLTYNKLIDGAAGSASPTAVSAQR